MSCNLHERLPLHQRAALLAPTPKDAELAELVFKENGVPIVIYKSFDELYAAILEGVGAVVVMEECFANPHAQKLVKAVSLEAAWSTVPFIVLARRNGRVSKIDVVIRALPSVVVLERPVKIASLVSAMRAALGNRARQYEIRDFLIATQNASEERARLHKAAEEARANAEAANRMKDEFLAVVSHELRTPLNAILGWARLLNDGRLTADQKSHAIEIIERNSLLQAKLIEDLLDVSRIISGTLKLDINRVDLPEIIDRALETLAPAIDAKGLRLEKNFNLFTAPVYGDASRLQQVVWNLVANAVKFTPKDGCVQIKLTRVKSHIEITVMDTGQGIDVDFLPYVFERFRQADASPTRRHGGLGLGLAIVRQLVELHGGSVTATSPGLNLGATFKVYLPTTTVHQEEPLSVAALPTDTEQHRIKKTPSLRHLRILVVDDEPENLNLLATALRQFGAEVMIADSAATGFEIFKSCMPDVVISDIGMPVEDGYSFIQRVRTCEHLHRNIPAIALTAYARTEDRIRALEAGFQAHVSKPVDPFEIGILTAALTKQGSAATKQYH